VESERNRPQPATVRGCPVADHRDALRPSLVGDHRPSISAVGVARDSRHLRPEYSGDVLSPGRVSAAIAGLTGPDDGNCSDHHSGIRQRRTVITWITTAMTNGYDYNDDDDDDDVRLTDRQSIVDQRQLPSWRLRRKNKDDERRNGHQN
jgi:hypothetical protein